MRVYGQWVAFDDGRVRPFLQVSVQDAWGAWASEYFLLDTGADSTVLGFDLLQRLGLPQVKPETAIGLRGIGGSADFVSLRTKIRFKTDMKRHKDFHGDFAAFTDPWAGNISLLGRDILDHFDVILARDHGEIVLLGKEHHYRIEP